MKVWFREYVSAERQGWKKMEEEEGNDQETNCNEEKVREGVCVVVRNTISLFDMEKRKSRCIEKERWLV